MKRVAFSSAFMVCFSLLCATPVHAEAFNSLEELKRCARLVDRDMRIDCYEKLGQRALNDVAEEGPGSGPAAAESAAMPAAENAAAASEVAADRLPPDLGGVDFQKQAGTPQEENRGHVTSCQRASDRKWFYIFESGQVWKQVDNRRIRHKECDFYVTITRDGLGYRMQIDGEKGKVRINRRR